MIKNKIYNQKGFSLVELMTAVAIFIIIIISVTAIFQKVLEGQMNAIAGQNTQESMRYAMEVISKEIRAAKKMDISKQCDLVFGINSVTDNKIYNTNAGATELNFRNKDKNCVRYYIDGATNQLMIQRGAAAAQPITPDEVKVEYLKFNIKDTPFNIYPISDQPLVTLSMDVSAATGKDIYSNAMKVQTTLSSRFYE